MPELGRELTTLREEVSETRKQSDKTEAQFRNLLETFKGFESRFAGLERRARASQLGTHLIAAAIVAGATYLAASAETRLARQELAETTQAAAMVKEEAARKAQELSKQLQDLKIAQAEKETAGETARVFIGHLEAKRDEQAIALLDKLDVSNLDPLARDLLTARAQRFREEMSEEAYKWGRELLSRSRRRDAIEALSRAVSIWPEGPNANTARYLLANSLRESKRYEEAAAAFADVRQHEKDRTILEEAQFWEAYCLARTGEVEQATRLFQDIANAGGRHSSSARTQLAALSTN